MARKCHPELARGKEKPFTQRQLRSSALEERSRRWCLVAAQISAREGGSRLGARPIPPSLGVLARSSVIHWRVLLGHSVSPGKPWPPLERNGELPPKLPQPRH